MGHIIIILFIPQFKTLNFLLQLQKLIFPFFATSHNISVSFSITNHDDFENCRLSPPDPYSDHFSYIF